MTIFHITTEEQWQKAQEQGFYTAESLEKEGFIHASTEEQIPKVLAVFYQGQSNLVLLEIDLEQLEPEVRWEAPVHPKGQSVEEIAETEVFPHIYGKINLNAVTDIGVPSDFIKIDQLEEKIRDFINSNRRKSILLQNSSNWNKLCSSLDVIGDTELAISSYPSLCAAVQDNGASYLIIYGILQTFQLQQDAARKIGDSLNIKVKLPRQLTEIANIRHDAVGHPFQRNENKLSNSSFIIRFSLSPYGFELITTSSNDSDHLDDKVVRINIPELIQIQKQYLGEVLTKVIIELERQEMEHKNKHKDIKLVDLFSTINYYFEKLGNANDGSGSFWLGKSHLQFIKESIEKFKSELINREEWDKNDAANYDYCLTAYPISELEKYFQGTGQSKLDDKDAFIFISFLYEQVKKLKNIAAEIDEEYGSIPMQEQLANQSTIETEQNSSCF